jgi:hypothetical protein
MMEREGTVSIIATETKSYYTCISNKQTNVIILVDSSILPKWGIIFNHITVYLVSREPNPLRSSIMFQILPGGNCANKFFLTKAETQISLLRDFISQK